MFYSFRQNNTGGSFIENDQVGTWVVVEAENAKQANEIAEANGLYFDGAGDCSCCGNRWSEQWDDEDGTETPLLYGVPYKEKKSKYWNESCVVYFADGTKENLTYEFEN